jgi:hypothetical protein
MFSRYLDKRSIKDKVKRRIKPYYRENDEWFIPTLEKIEIRSISWEAVLDTINKEDSEIGGSLFEYYSLCLRFNS